MPFITSLGSPVVQGEKEGTDVMSLLCDVIKPGDILSPPGPGPPPNSIAREMRGPGNPRGKDLSRV